MKGIELDRRQLRGRRRRAARCLGRLGRLAQGRGKLVRFICEDGTPLVVRLLSILDWARDIDPITGDRIDPMTGQSREAEIQVAWAQAREGKADGGR